MAVGDNVTMGYVEYLDELEARFEREMKRTKTLDRIYAVICTLVLGLITGFFLGIPVNKYLHVHLQEFSWPAFFFGFIGVWVFLPGIHKGIRAWRERRTWIG